MKRIDVIKSFLALLFSLTFFYGCSAVPGKDEKPTKKLSEVMVGEWQVSAMSMTFLGATIVTAFNGFIASATVTIPGFPASPPVITTNSNYVTMLYNSDNTVSGREYFTNASPIDMPVIANYSLDDNAGIITLILINPVTEVSSNNTTNIYTGTNYYYCTSVYDTSYRVYRMDGIMTYSMYSNVVTNFTTNVSTAPVQGFNYMDYRKK